MVIDMMQTRFERCPTFVIVKSMVFLLETLDDIIVLINLMLLDLYDDIGIDALHNYPKLLIISIMQGNDCRNVN
jgi:hypothetical protein